MARALAALVALALLLCVVDAKRPANTTEFDVHKPISDTFAAGQSQLYWYNARTDSTALRFLLSYAPLPILDSGFEMIARFSTDLWQPPVAFANCSNGTCSIEFEVRD